MEKLSFFWKTALVLFPILIAIVTVFTENILGLVILSILVSLLIFSLIRMIDVVIDVKNRMEQEIQSLHQIITSTSLVVSGFKPLEEFDQAFRDEESEDDRRALKIIESDDHWRNVRKIFRPSQDTPETPPSSP